MASVVPLPWVLWFLQLLPSVPSQPIATNLINDLYLSFKKSINVCLIASAVPDKGVTWPKYFEPGSSINVMCSSTTFFRYHLLPFWTFMIVWSLRPSKNKLFKTSCDSLFICCKLILFLCRALRTLFLSTTFPWSSGDISPKSCKTADAIAAAVLSEIPWRSQALA